MDNVRERVDALQRVGESSLRARGITPEALEKLNNLNGRAGGRREELKAE